MAKSSTKSTDKSDKVKVCWLSGNYGYCEDILNQIKSLLKSPEIFIYDKDSDADYVENQILSSGLFAENRLIIIKHLYKFYSSSVKSNNRWLNIFNSIPEDCIVVIRDIDPSDAQVIYKHVSEIGKVFCAPQYLKRDDAFNWISKFFKENSKETNDENIFIILDSIGAETNGYDIDKMNMCCRKICDYIGNKKKNICKEDIALSSDKYCNVIIWDILSSFEERDFVKCISLVKKSCDRDGNCSEAINQIFSMILWKLRIMLFVKESISIGMTKEQSIENVKKLHKFTREGSGLNIAMEVETNKNGTLREAYSAAMASSLFRSFGDKKASIDSFGRSEIFKLIISVSECIRNIRHESNDSNCMLMAENFFFESCKIIQPELLENIRRVRHGGRYSF